MEDNLIRCGGRDAAQAFRGGIGRHELGSPIRFAVSRLSRSNLSFVSRLKLLCAIGACSSEPSTSVPWAWRAVVRGRMWKSFLHSFARRRHCRILDFVLLTASDLRICTDSSRSLHCIPPRIASTLAHAITQLAASLAGGPGLHPQCRPEGSCFFPVHCCLLLDG